MTRRLLLSYLAVTLFVLIVLEIPLGVSIANGERRQLIASVRNDALVMATLVGDDLQAARVPAATAEARAYAKRTGGRIVVVGLDGVSVLDTGDSTGRRFANRPEITQALKGSAASGIRHSKTLRTDLVFVAVPVASSGTVHGAVRITYPASALASRTRRTWIALGLIAAVVLTVVMLLGIVLARSVTRPIRTLEGAAGDLARGNLDARAPVPNGPQEVASLVTAFNDMAARLQELVRSQRAFIADASHQLRTPLTALRLRLENLEDTLGKRGHNDVEASIRETERLSRIVDGLLALARAEGTRPDRAPINVAAIVLERAAVWEPLAAEHDIALKTGPVTGTALAVPGLLEQMLDNLIANAIDAAPPGSTITLRVAPAEDAASESPADAFTEIHVTDNGPGMTAEERERAFDRFWGGSHGGSGLGLAIVLQMARSSGGDAALFDAAGGGLDAVIRLRSD